jgi:phospholipid/cholesterol/gamma-HCH transport system ATP-binding protein
MNTTPSPLVELRDLRFGYGERVILDGITLTVPKGKVTALMGASGGGKTTVLRLIGGQYRAQSGSLLFDGQEVGGLSPEGLYAARRRMGMLYQFGALFTDLSVFDNVAFPLREHTSLTPALIRDIVLMKLEAACAVRATSCPAKSRVAWRAASPWPGPLPWTPSWSCTTSLLRGWTRFLWARPPA